MASVSHDKDGTRRIQFIDAHKKRRTIRLGKVTAKTANEIKLRVEAINIASILQVSLDADTARWLASIGDELAGKLQAVGLIEGRANGTLKQFVEEYVAQRTDVKATTILVMNRSKNLIVRYFGADRPLRSITPGECDGFLIWMKKEKYAAATAGRTLKHARQFFTAARRRKLIFDNPFEGIKPGRMDNPERLFYVTREMTQKLIDASPCGEWRAIIAIARFGGLRCPSELLALTWADVDWERNRLLVHSSKLENNVAMGKRWLPLFPEIRPHLEALFDAAEAGQVHVINRYRDAEQNLRTTFSKIIDRAGLLPWPRLFQNLRSTRETELMDQFPDHVVTAWIGNSVKVAAKHYLQVTDQHFEEAIRGKNPAQNPAQSGVEKGTPELPSDQSKNPKVIPSQALTQNDISSVQEYMARVGLEPTRLSTQASKTCVAAITPPSQSNSTNVNEEPPRSIGVHSDDVRK